MSQFDNDSGILLTIPIHYYIKKYLSKTHQVQPFFDLSLNGCHISAIILEPIDKGYINPSDRIKMKETYDDFLTFRLNTTLHRQTRFKIDANSVRRINKLLENKFNHEFYSFVDNLIDHYKSTGKETIYQEDCIRQFISFYDLPEDYIQFETLKKRYYRYRVPPLKAIEPTPREIVKQQLQLNFIDLESAS